MLEPLPTLSNLYVRPRREYKELSDFDDLPAFVHEKIRSFISTEVPCSQCTNHLCSCSGGARSEIILLPGERAWSESHLRKEYRGTNPVRYPLSGDCTQLEGIKCGAGYYKPFDCISFPLQPVVQAGKLVPMFSKHCSIHPGDLHPQWVLDRWRAWEYIFNLIPEWVEIYGRIPSGEHL